MMLEIFYTYYLHYWYISFSYLLRQNSSFNKLIALKIKSISVYQYNTLKKTNYVNIYLQFELIICDGNNIINKFSLK